jgi:hypothetical protein
MEDSKGGRDRLLPTNIDLHIKLWQQKLRDNNKSNKEFAG